MSNSDNKSDSSHRSILQSAAVFGSASAVKVVVGLIKVKFVAVMLGPVGIGLLGLYESLMTMVASLVGLGLSNSGVRQIATSNGNTESITIIRSMLWYASIGLGLLGMIVLWLLRDTLALWIFNDISYAQNVGYLGIAVLLTLVVGAQMAVLQGLRRINDMALVTIISSVAGLLISVAIIWLLGNGGIVWYIIAGPATTILVAAHLMRKLSVPSAGIKAIVKGQAHLNTMLVLGVTFMVTQFITEATRLGVRSYIVSELGIDASGQYQAVWAISLTYLGFVITAMTADYYPRLTGVIHDPEKANRIVSEQTEVALLVAGPLILVMQALAPWVIRVLYSSDFLSSVEILRWLILGDTLKLLAWPLGFVLIAKGKWGLFFITQLVWNLAYLILVWIGLPKLGLVVTGMAYVLAYSLVIILNTLIIKWVTGYQWGWRNILTGAGIFILCALIYGLSIWSVAIAAIAGVFVAAITGWFSLKRIVSLTGVNIKILQLEFRGKPLLNFLLNKKHQE